MESCWGTSTRVGQGLRDLRAILACDRCKRRKIKCDRVLPACHTCSKTSRACSYPETAHKPGPKPGVTQRRKRAHLTGGSPASSNASVRVDSGRSNQVSIRELDHDSHRGREEDRRERSKLSGGLSLSHLLHPFHEPMQNETASALLTLSEAPSSPRPTSSTDIENIYKVFGITAEVYQFLLEAYFNNMTAFTLFHRPTFDVKISSLTPLQLEALLAAMFSFSARFKDIHQPGVTLPSGVPSPEYFYDLGTRKLDKELRKCGDGVPSLALLQAKSLLTFQQLIKGVRGKAWRSVGECVRLGYELGLHLIDKPYALTNVNAADRTDSVTDEEKRRLWWTIWEFDVFASTIRRLPTGIGWTQNQTFLPVSDETWFTMDAGSKTRSCFLDPDGAVAWKALKESENQSPKAWFIVANALMRCTHLLSYPSAYSSPPSTSLGGASLETLANALYCFTSALPYQLSYRGEFLPFNVETRNADVQKHCVHIMTQLSRFMINHHQVYGSTSRHLSHKKPQNSHLNSQDQAAWNHYLSAASEIVTIIRNCSSDHVQFVNPFLASTIWLAAGAQVVSKTFESPSLVDARTASSNLDLLSLNLSAYVEFWGVSTALSQNLQRHGMIMNPRQPARPAAMPANGHIFPSLKSVSRGSVGFPYSTPREMETQYSSPIPGREDAVTGYYGWEGDIPSSDIGLQQGLGQDTCMGSGIDLWGWGVEELMNYGELGV